jgi:hypothetical protein
VVDYSAPASIEIDLSTLERSESGTITGVIHLHLGSQAFPETSWNDFPVVIVGWWLDALHRLRDGSANHAECRFMDGPCLFNVQPAGQSWRLEAVHHDEVVQVELVDPQLLWRSAVSTAHDLVIVCQQRGWEGRDVQVLAHRLKRASDAGAV